MLALNLKDKDNKNKALLLLVLVKMMSVFGFAVMFSSLLLILKGQYHYSLESSASLAGMVIGLHYLLPMLGGTLGDKLINFRWLFLGGHLFQILGSILFLLFGEQFLSVALSCFLLQSMTSSVSQNMFLNWIFEGRDTERKAAYYWTYGATNIGFVIGFAVSGYAELISSYNIAFICSIVMSTIVAMLLMRIYYLFKKGAVPNTPKLSICDSCGGGLFVMGLTLAPLSMLIHYVTIAKGAIIFSALFLVAIKYFSIVLKAKCPDYKKNLYRMGCYYFYVIIFYSVYMLIPTFLIAFMKYDVDSTVRGLDIPPQWFEIFTALFVAVLCPLFGSWLKRAKENSSIVISNEQHFLFAIVSLVVALLWLTAGLGAVPDGSKVPLYSIVMCLLFICIGEIALAPASQAMVGELIKKEDQGFFGGVSSTLLGISIFISNYLSNTYLMRFVSEDVAKLHLHDAAVVFGEMTAAVLLCAMMVLLISKAASRLEFAQ